MPQNDYGICERPLSFRVCLIISSPPVRVSELLISGDHQTIVHMTTVLRRPQHHTVVPWSSRLQHSSTAR